MKSATAIGFDYRPSRWFATCSVGIWLFALLAIAVLQAKAGGTTEEVAARALTSVVLVECLK